MIWDEETLQIMEANEATLQTYGYSKEEFLQLKKSDLIIKEDQSNSNVHRHVNSKGATLLMEMSYHKIDYKGRKAVLALGQDVTEKILLENSLAEERQIRQKQITDAVITGQEKERSQLGEELHDNINQILATTRLYIECAVSDEHPRPDLVKESKLLLERAMNEIRQLSKTLLPPSLGEIGLVEAISDLVENINETNALEIENKWRGFNEEALGEKLKLTIFRIVQEQMSNITKHSQAKKASISLINEDDNVVLEVSDNGIGFNPSLKRTGLGLRNMTSRAEVNNGTLTINSQPGAGCIITVSFPTS
jgi:signal transduction histidine kinase